MSADEFDALWRAGGSSRSLGIREDLERLRRTEPWSLRMSDAGEAVVLQPWRDHLAVLQIRAAWCSPKRVTVMVEDVREVASEKRFTALLSPLMNEAAVKPYVGAGLSATIGLVAYTFDPVSLPPRGWPNGIGLRPAAQMDVEAIASLEATCFSAFWSHSRAEVERHLHAGRVVVAEEDAEVVGYTLTTLDRGAATLARIAVRPDSRGRGLGQALVSEASEYAAQAGAALMSLCTQEANDASRALYASLGLLELRGRLVLAADPSVRF